MPPGAAPRGARARRVSSGDPARVERRPNGPPGATTRIARYERHPARRRAIVTGARGEAPGFDAHDQQVVPGATRSDSHPRDRTRKWEALHPQRMHRASLCGPQASVLVAASLSSVHIRFAFVRLEIIRTKSERQDNSETFFSDPSMGCRWHMQWFVSTNHQDVVVSASVPRRAQRFAYQSGADSAGFGRCSARSDPGRRSTRGVKCGGEGQRAAEPA